MKFFIKFPYRAKIITARGRKWWDMYVTEDAEVTIRETTDAEAPVAAAVHIRRAHSEGAPKEERLDFRWHDGSFYRVARNNDDRKRQSPWPVVDVFERIGIGSFAPLKSIVISPEEHENKPVSFFMPDAPALASLDIKNRDEVRRDNAFQELTEMMSLFLSVDGMLWEKINEPVFTFHRGEVRLEPFHERLLKAFKEETYLTLPLVDESRPWFDDLLREAKFGAVDVEIGIPEAFAHCTLQNNLLTAIEELLRKWLATTSGTRGNPVPRWAEIPSDAFVKWALLRDELLSVRRENANADLNKLTNAADEFLSSLNEMERYAVKTQAEAIERWHDRPLEISFSGN